MQSARETKGGAEREVLTLMTRRLQYSRPSRENCGHWVRWVLLPPSLATVSLISDSTPLVVLKKVGSPNLRSERPGRARHRIIYIFLSYWLTLSSLF